MKIMQILTNLLIVFWVLSQRFLVTVKFGFTWHKVTFYAFHRADICISIRAKEVRVFRYNVLNTKVNACKVLSYTYMCSNAFNYIIFFIPGVPQVYLTKNKAKYFIFIGIQLCQTSKVKKTLQ